MCEIIQEMLAEERMEGRMEGEIKQAQLTAFKLATRGESLDEISDIVGYDMQTVKTWLGNQSPAASDSPVMRV